MVPPTSLEGVLDCVYEDLILVSVNITTQLTSGIYSHVEHPLPLQNSYIAAVGVAYTCACAALDNSTFKIG